AAATVPLTTDHRPLTTMQSGLPELILIGEEADRAEAGSNSVAKRWGVDQDGAVDDQLARPSEQERGRGARRRGGPLGHRHQPADRPASPGARRGDPPQRGDRERAAE